jgi:hypothetical protein
MNYEEVEELDKQINSVKVEEYEKLTRPVCAFIIFERDEGMT